MWQGFSGKQGKPWDYTTERGLREFLLERVHEGYVFPINPVWPVRDKGWWEIYEEMMKHEQAKHRALQKTSQWTEEVPAVVVPAGDLVLRTLVSQEMTSSSKDKAKQLHDKYKDGFMIVQK